MTAPREPLLDDAALDKAAACVASHGPNACPVSDATMVNLIAQAREALRLRERVSELERENARYHDERNEVASLNDYLAQTLRDLTESHAKLRMSIAAAQASEREAREAIVHAIALIQVGANPDSERRAVFEHLTKFLARPADDAALKAALAQERERCAEAARWCPDSADGYTAGPIDIAERIRALGDAAKGATEGGGE